MARGRIVDTRIWSNENFAALPCWAQLLQIGIVTNADDQGRMKANPAYLRSVVFPYGEMSLKDIAEWLDAIEANDTITRYEVDGKEYLQLLKWWEYQSLSFAMPSDCPAPDGWKDRIRYTIKGPRIVTYNWTAANGELIPDTCDENGDPYPAQARQATPPPAPQAPPQDEPPPLPTEKPYGQPYGLPHGTLNKDQIKNNDLNKDYNYIGDLEAKTIDGCRRRDRRTDPDFGDLCTTYEQEIGMLTNVISDSLSEMLDEYKSPSLIAEAFKEAAMQNKRKLSYVEGILKNWRAEGKNGKTAKQPAKAKALPVIAGRLVDNPFSL
jgi:DnaD/phage-associated family protein